ncbi:MAG: DHA2 family efflux MFS transporter permease subunit [Micavibrio sp.]|nr:DHA2 family efflux MFS transporter permease subunit [Micavibrio sp.]
MATVSNNPPANIGSPTAKPAAEKLPVLQGGGLVAAGLLLAVANFIVVLDTTIANVSVPHIAGGLAVSSNEGTYVITSYAVAEAITVPLTGWLANRFGTVRVFTTSMLLFGIFSLLCGMAGSLGFLVMARVFQGLSGGPLIPLSQTLLMRVFPKDKQTAALGLWSMTTLIAPILGPIVGGYICDNWSWPVIFYINLPIAALCSFLAYNMLVPFETRKRSVPIDFVGLTLLIVWVSAMQIMLDEGKNYDWFSSSFIITLAIVAVVGFISFVIWELTDKQPVVDLRVFRHRGYTASVITISLAFGAFFSSVVLMPLWLQGYMGYTATWSGYVSAATGVLAVIIAPFAAKLSAKVDARILVFFGVMWMGFWTMERAFNTTDMSYAQIAFPLLMQGIGLPFFFIPLTGLSLSSVNPEETAGAAGLMSFLRTVSGAFATSIVTTSWDNEASHFKNDLVGIIASPQQLASTLSAGGGDPQKALGLMDQLVQNQSIMLSTNAIFFTASLAFSLAACAIWLAPKPTRKADTSAAH